MDSGYLREKFHELMHSPGKLAGVLVGLAVVVAVMVFVMVVMIKKRRLLYKQAYVLEQGAPTTDDGHDTDKKRPIGGGHGSVGGIAELCHGGDKVNRPREVALLNKAKIQSRPPVLVYEI